MNICDEIVEKLMNNDMSKEEKIEYLKEIIDFCNNEIKDIKDDNI